MPFHHVRVTRFGSNRQGVITTLNKIIRVAERIQFKHVREHLLWLRKQLYGKELEPETEKANNSINPLCLPTLSGAEEQFIKSLRIVDASRRSLRLNHIILQSLLMIKQRRQQTGRLLLIIAYQLKGLRQKESAKEYVMDARYHLQPTSISMQAALANLL